MENAFCVDKVTAFEELCCRRMSDGEPVDVYVADVKNLVRFIDSNASKEWVKSTVIRELPDAIKQYVKSACAIDHLQLSKVIVMARSIIKTDICMVGAAQKGQPSHGWRSTLSFSTIESCRCGDRRGYL